MAEKVEKLRRLLREGYEIDAVESDATTLQATLRRGSERIVLRFLPSEAEAILLDPRPLH